MYMYSPSLAEFRRDFYLRDRRLADVKMMGITMHGYRMIKCR